MATWSFRHFFFYFISWAFRVELQRFDVVLKQSSTENNELERNGMERKQSVREIRITKCIAFGLTNLLNVFSVESSCDNLRIRLHVNDLHNVYGLW